MKGGPIGPPFAFCAAAMLNHMVQGLLSQKDPSLLVECDSEAEVDRLYGVGAEGEGALMPLGSYDFSRTFGRSTAGSASPGG
jgi:hypothetical protein